MTPVNWLLPETPPEDFRRLLAHLPNLVQAVVWRRGLTTPEAIDAFLQPEYGQLADPFLFRSMAKVVERIITAITTAQPILIYGDYDADGVTSTAILVETLQALGASVRWYLPERLREGYGLNSAAMARLAADGAKLIITVDCGTSNVTEIGEAQARGVDVIVLDHHHQPAELPPAYAIVNPVFMDEQYPDRGLSSAGVAFTVIRALLQTTSYGRTLNRGLPPGWEKWLLDLVAISTVADMMPLTGENRTLVRYGIMVLRKTRRLGLRALFAIMGTDLSRADEYTVGFLIAPRLNAAGRLKHASLALELLLTQDVNQAYHLAAQLHHVNHDRQRLTELAVAEALEQVAAEPASTAVTVFAPHWSPGILGLIAGRLADRLWRPVLVMTENDGEIVGSGRSIPGFNIMSVMDEGRPHLARFGGHPGACGFMLQSIDGRSAFEQWFRQAVENRWRPEDAARTLMIDGVANFTDVSPAALDLLEALGPFGMAHPRPLFVAQQARTVSVQPVGHEGRHLRMTLADGSHQLQGIAFRQGERLAELQAIADIDVVFEPSWNVWQGRREPQLKIIDFRPHGH